MIKVLTIERIDNFQLDLQFSNGESGTFDVAAYIDEKQGSLLEPLRNLSYNQRCFIDAGALCWPNGLELSGHRVFELSKVHA